MENIRGLYIMLLVSAGVIIGALFTLGLTQPWTQKQQVFPQQQSLELNPDLKAKIEAELKKTDVENVVILTPKVFVSKDYHDSLNTIVRLLQDLRRINVALVPLLESINAKSTAGDYVGLVDLIIKARDLNNDQEKALREFKNQLDRLRLANQATSQNDIQGLTAKLLGAGDVFYQAIGEYSTILDRLLGGEAPDAKLFQNLTTIVGSAQKSSEIFSIALKDLLAKIADIVTSQEK